ncbi:MAG: transcription elongation factor GreA [Chloroflexi bacterium]|nr:transcription elongation factor GreA [Chloroflexota bacterium]
MAEPTTAVEALTHFINALEPETAKNDRPAVEQFIAWFGSTRSIGELSGEDVTRYHEAEAEGDSAADLPHLEPLRAFLAYCSRMAFTDANLVPFLQLGAHAGGARGLEGAAEELGGEAYHVTLEGLQVLERQLDKLKGERPVIAEKLRAALADKDFRENAPLDAARDEQAHLEARIRDIEQRLRRAVIIDRDSKRGRANVGSTVRLLNLDRNREQTFTLVSPTEVDPAKGKISIESPVGLAVRNRAAGEEIVVQAPAGPISFRLLEVVD